MRFFAGNARDDQRLRWVGRTILTFFVILFAGVLFKACGLISHIGWPQ